MLADSYGRIATDLRVSLTDRCNLRCAYCMPAEGLDWLPRPALLTDDEVVRLVRIGVERLGITEVRFTGGEPLLRRGLPGHRRPYRGAAAPAGDLGHHERDRAGPARGPAGRGRPGPGERVAGHTAAGSVQASWPGATASATCCAGWPPPRPPGSRRSRSTRCSCAMSTMARRPRCCRFCLEHSYQLRFIEQMPLDAQHGWRRENMVTAAEILDALSAEFTLTPGRLGGPGIGARGSLPGRRRARAGRHNRLGDQAVLRGLRPGPAHRRRPDP